MAVQWGKWLGPDPKMARIGIEYTSVPTPTSATQKTARVTARIWVQGWNWFSDSNNYFEFSGTLGSTGSSPLKKAIRLTTMRETQLLHTLTRDVPLASSGPTPVTVTASIRGIEYIGLSTKPTFTLTTSIPAKPAQELAAPGTPASLTATRVSDTTTDFTWPAASGTVSRYRLEQYDHAKPDSGWVAIAYPTGLSYRYSAGTANNRYDHRIRAENTAGVSAWRYTTDDLYTSPAAPSNVRASKVGSSIVVTLTDQSPWNTDFEYQVSIDGAAYVAAGIVPNGSNLEYQNPDPTSTHVFRARAVRGSLVSGWSAPSNVVLLSARPNPPRLLSPAGNAVPVTQTSLRFEWEHNPVDTTGQMEAQIRYQRDGGAFTTLSVTGANEFINAAVSLSAGTYSWQARSRGTHPEFSDWSDLSVFLVGHSPVVAITSPSGTMTASRVPASWTYSDSGGHEQASARVRYLLSGVPVFDYTLLGSIDAYSPPVRLEEGDYTVEVTVTMFRSSGPVTEQSGRTLPSSSSPDRSETPCHR